MLKTASNSASVSADKQCGFHKRLDSLFNGTLNICSHCQSHFSM